LYIVWLLYKSVELKINELRLDLQHVHCWEGRTFSSSFSFWLSSPLLLMQYSKIQPKKSNAKNGKDKRVFFLRLNGPFNLNQCLIYDEGLNPLSHNLNLASICWLFHLANGCFNFDTSLSSYKGVTKETSVILCFLAKLVSSPGTGPFGLSLSYSSLTYLIWTFVELDVHDVCCSL